MFCKQCGQENPDGTAFCTNCGSPVQRNDFVSTPVTGTTNMGGSSEFDYTPISMWGYFGYEILFSIPCVGFILLLVFSFGGTKNINLRNFARSYFCFMIVMVILSLILFLIGGGLSVLDSL